MTSPCMPCITLMSWGLWFGPSSVAPTPPRRCLRSWLLLRLFLFLTKRFSNISRKERNTFRIQEKNGYWVVCRFCKQSADEPRNVNVCGWRVQGPRGWVSSTKPLRQPGPQAPPSAVLVLRTRTNPSSSSSSSQRLPVYSVEMLSEITVYSACKKKTALCSIVPVSWQQYCTLCEFK